MSELVKVCNLDEVKEGELLPVTIEQVPLLVTKLNGKVIVSSRICTHKTFDLAEGIYADGFLTCPLHASTFELETGEALNPPAIDPLTIYPVVIKDNEVYIEI